jgi:hypothetical protein
VTLLREYSEVQGEALVMAQAKIADCGLQITRHTRAVEIQSRPPVGLAGGR